MPDYTNYITPLQGPIKTDRVNTPKTKAVAQRADARLKNAKREKSLLDRAKSLGGSVLDYIVPGDQAFNVVQEATNERLPNPYAAGATTIAGAPVVKQVFDILDTPRAAVVSGANEAAKLLNNHVTHNPDFQDNGKGFMDNMWSNMSTGEFLTQNRAIKNFAESNPKVFGIGTIAADMVVDPLSKFHGKVGKPLSAELKAKTYLDETKAAIVAGDLNVDLMNHYAKTAAQAASATTGKPWTQLFLSEPIQAVAAQQTSAQMLRDAHVAAQQIEQEGKYLSLYLGHHEIGRSTKAYDVLDAVKRRITPAKGWLDTAFNPAGEMPKELYTAQRVAENYNVSRFLEEQPKIDAIFNAPRVGSGKHPLLGANVDRLTRAEMKELAYARESGTVLNGTFSNGLVKADVQAKVDQVFQDIWASEVAAGIHPPNAQYDPTYLYHHYTSKNPKHVEQARQAIGLGNKATTKGGVLERMDDILNARLGKHYADMAQNSFMKQADLMFGFNPNDVVDATKQAVRTKPIGSKSFTSKQAERLSVENAMAMGYRKPTGAAAKFMREGTLLHPNVDDALNRYLKIFSSEEATSQLAKHFDSATQQWKFLVTAANPGHHVRNLISDIYMNAMDGVSPRAYYKARQILKPDGVIGEYGARKFGNVMVDGDNIRTLFHTTGASSGMTATEFNKATHFRVKKLIRKVSDVREEYPRLAHFIDAFEKEAGDAKNWEDIQAAAARARDRVWTFNYDYGALTPFEQKMRRVIPFYPWMRKNMEQQLTSLFLRPGKLSLGPRTMSAVETLLGVDPDEKNVIERYIPEWLRDLQPMQVSGGENPRFMGLNLPFQDPWKFTKEFDKGIGPGIVGAGKELIQNAHPLFRVASETVTGKNTLTGAPQSFKDMIVNQLPQTRTINTVTSDDPTTQSWIPFWNYLTGLSQYELTDKRKFQALQSQYMPIEADIKKQREEALKALYGDRYVPEDKR